MVKGQELARLYSVQEHAELEQTEQEYSNALTTFLVDSDDAATDVDVHLLDGLDEAACLARGDTTAGAELAAGTYYVVVDSYVRDLVTTEGPFALDVAFTPTPGTSCAGPDADAGVDGGIPDDGGADGGCCQTGSDGRASLLPLALAALALRRRRRPIA